MTIEEIQDRIRKDEYPAEVCTKCGERTYSSEVTGDLLKFARDEFKPTKTIVVPVFDFAGKT